jgi:hypothetical protein
MRRFKIGDRVTGLNCIGNPIEGTITYISPEGAKICYLVGGSWATDKDLEFAKKESAYQTWDVIDNDMLVNLIHQGKITLADVIKVFKKEITVEEVLEEYEEQLAEKFVKSEEEIEGEKYVCFTSTATNLNEVKVVKEYDYIRPTHYNQYSMETIVLFEKGYGKEATALWCEMTALKYRMRMGTKPGESVDRDLDKERWYLNKAAELRK